MEHERLDNKEQADSYKQDDNYKEQLSLNEFKNQLGSAIALHRPATHVSMDCVAKTKSLYIQCEAFGEQTSCNAVVVYTDNSRVITYLKYFNRSRLAKQPSTSL